MNPADKAARIAGALYLSLAVSLTSLLLPDYAGVVTQFAFPAQLGELWIMLWLLIKGVKVQALTPAPA